jgi:hypothetical protein
VLDVRDEPVEGVRVRVRVPVGAGKTGREGLTMETDREGWFGFDVEGEFDPRMDGPVELSFSKEGWVRSDHRLPSWKPGRGVKVVKNLRVAGVVTGLVSDDEGRPVPDAVVYAIGADVPGVRDLVEVIHTRTESDGTFRLEGLPAGRIDVGVRAEGFRGALLPEVEVVGRETTRVADLALDRGKTIAGRVVLSDGKGPVTQAFVRVYRDPALKDFRVFGRRGIGPGGGIARVDSEGRFRVTGLADGKWEVDSVTLGLAPVTSGASGVEAGTEDLELVFERAARVLIRVIDAETGKPIPRFEFVVSNLSGPKRPDGRPALTDTGDLHSPAGEYGFPAREDELYGVEVAVDGYEDARRTVGPLKGHKTNVVAIPMRRR